MVKTAAWINRVLVAHRDKKVVILGRNYHLVTDTHAEMCGGSKAYRDEGIITPSGLVQPRKVPVLDAAIYEAGFTMFVWQAAPLRWKDAIGKDWEKVLKTIILEQSATSYLSADKPEPYRKKSLGAHRKALEEGIGANIPELFAMFKDIQLISYKGESFLTPLHEKHRQAAKKLGVELEAVL